MAGAVFGSARSKLRDDCSFLAPPVAVKRSRSRLGQRTLDDPAADRLADVG